MSDHAARALALAAERPVFDAHADSLQLACDLGRDLSQEGPGQLDLARGREGGLGELVCVCWADAKYAAEPGAARARTRDLLKAFHRQLERSPDALAWAGNAELARAARERGAVAGIPGIEGGHSIEGSLDELEAFFRHGVRVMTLVWNNHLAWIRSCRDGAGAEVPEGLSDFGRDVVRRMNRLGMVVDLSHAGRQSFFDALEATDKPVIASHSGCMAVNEHPRNLDDEQLRALTQNGGVVGIVFCSAFLDAACMPAQKAAAEDPQYKALEGANDTELFLRQGEWLQAHLPPLPLVRVVEHVVHAVETAGIDHVGLGSDFDGILHAPQGLEDARGYPNLAAALFARGFSEGDVRKVLGDNMRRVFAEVTGPGTAAATAALEPL